VQIIVRHAENNSRAVHGTIATVERETDDVAVRVSSVEDRASTIDDRGEEVDEKFRQIDTNIRRVDDSMQRVDSVTATPVITVGLADDGRAGSMI